MEEEDENFGGEAEFCFILSLQTEIWSQEDENKGAWLRQGVFLTEEKTSAKNQGEPRFTFCLGPRLQCLLIESSVNWRLIHNIPLPPYVAGTIKSDTIK